MIRRRVGSPRARWYASAIFIAVSTDSEPLLVKNTRSMPSGVTRATAVAASNTSGCPIWKVGAKSIVAACRWIASTIGARQWPALTHHSPAVPSRIERPS